MKVVSVVGYKKTGKTTLITQLIRTLSGKGRIGTVKQIRHHRFNLENTDTCKHFDAGAAVSALPETELFLVQRNPPPSEVLDALADSGMEYALHHIGRPRNFMLVQSCLFAVWHGHFTHCYFGIQKAWVNNFCPIMVKSACIIFSTLTPP